MSTVKCFYVRDFDMRCVFKMNSVGFLLLYLAIVLYVSGQSEDFPTDDVISPDAETTTDDIERTEPIQDETESPFFHKTKIVGGVIVERREDFPYQVSIRYIKPNYPFCGGTIISHKHILTAAHCLVDDKGVVVSKSLIYVVVGDLRTDTPTENTLSKDVLEIITHEEYSTKTLQNDIAILKIASLGTFNEFIDSVPLSDESPAEGTSCVVSGWGTTSAGGFASVALRSVEVPIASFESCKAKYSNQIYEGMVCAGYVEGQKDACQGDSGGPLVCNDILIGVVSWGYSCAQPDFPGIYTDVSKYREWIKLAQGEEEVPVDPGDENFIINEYVARRRADFPYQVSLRFTVPNYHFCGAAIIDQSHVVTAAHCVVDRYTNEIFAADSLSVTVGDLNVREESDSTTYRSVLEIYVHEDYRSATMENDIAILKVSDFDEWTAEINRVTLAENAPSVGISCTTSGWGAVSPFGNYSDVLRFVEIPILSREVCTDYYTDYVRDGMICAGDVDGHKKLCQEDSGGPLICDSVLTGVVSWGYNCTQPGYPNVYTSVSNYNEWIGLQLRKSSSSKFAANSLTVLFLTIAAVTKLFII